MPTHVLKNKWLEIKSCVNAQPRPVDGRIETLKALMAFVVVVAVETWLQGRVLHSESFQHV